MMGLNSALRMFFLHSSGVHFLSSHCDFFTPSQKNADPVYITFDFVYIETAGEAKKFFFSYLPLWSACWANTLTLCCCLSGCWLYCLPTPNSRGYSLCVSYCFLPRKMLVTGSANSLETSVLVQSSDQEAVRSFLMSHSLMLFGALPLEEGYDSGEGERKMRISFSEVLFSLSRE